jgi:hypothetical protein
MRLVSLLSIAFALHTAVAATVGNGRRSALTSATILTPDFVEFVQAIVDADEIKGLTMAVVHKTGPAELGAWGINSENGTKMTTDVRRNYAELPEARGTDVTMICLADTVQYCLLLKGLPLRFSGDIDRRFCTWSQYNSSSPGLINPDLEDQGGGYPTKRLETYRSLGKSKGQPDRYPFPCVRSPTVRFLFYTSAYEKAYCFCPQQRLLVQAK